MTQDDIQIVKSMIEEALRSQLHDGNYAQRINLFDLFGALQTVTASPTGVPANIYGQVVIYNSQLWYYDFGTNSWQHVANGGFSFAKDTNGTTPVNVFGSSGAPFALTVTAVYVISKDTTAGNIVLKQATNTVATIAKGTVAGAMVGATSLSNTAYAKGDACTIVSDSAGNATVIINFTA